MMSARTWHRKEISNSERVTSAQYEKMRANFDEIQEAIYSLAETLERPMEELKADPRKVQNWAAELGAREQDGTPLSARALEFEAWLEASNSSSAKARVSLKFYRRLQLVASAQLFIRVKVLRWALNAVKVCQQRSAFTAFLNKAFKPKRIKSLKSPKSPLEHRPQHQTNAPNIAA